MSATIAPVILSGGSGTRLWPLSRAQLPKQFLPLVSDATMLQETWQRVAAIENILPPLVVCNEEHRFLAAEQLREAGASGARVMLEPAGRNTAPAIAVAAFELESIDPAALMLILPADHLIESPSAFQLVVRSAAELAAAGYLVTFGIPPGYPATGFGYIEKGGVVSMDGPGAAYLVQRFIEKPQREAAKLAE